MSYFKVGEPVLYVGRDEDVLAGDMTRLVIHHSHLTTKEVTITDTKSYWRVPRSAVKKFTPRVLFGLQSELRGVKR